MYQPVSRRLDSRKCPQEKSKPITAKVYAFGYMQCPSDEVNSKWRQEAEAFWMTSRRRR
jgi:hypothetical protein